MSATDVIRGTCQHQNEDLAEALGISAETWAGFMAGSVTLDSAVLSHAANILWGPSVEVVADRITANKSHQFAWVNMPSAPGPKTRPKVRSAPPPLAAKRNPYKGA